MVRKIGQTVGFAYAQYWRVSNTGFATGQVNPDNVATNTVYPALLVRNVMAANLPSPSRVIAQLRGGDKWRGSVMFGGDNVPAVDTTFSEFNADLLAMAEEAVVDQTTNTQWSQVSRQDDRVVLPQMGSMYSAIWQNRDEGADGVNRWINYFMPRGQLEVGNPNLNYQSPADYPARFTPTYSSYMPHGLAFSDYATNTPNGKAWLHIIVSDYPLALVSWFADGAATTFTVPYKPASTVVTVNESNNEMCLNGTLTALSSITTAGLATLSAAGSANDEVGLLYGMLPDAIPTA